VIAKAVGAEAGVVVNCTAAGICMTIAGCMTGRNLARIERLPDTDGLKNEVILQRGHNVTYGGYVEQNIRTVGAKTVEIGAATECGVYQLEDAITDKTACALYVVSHHTVQSGLIDLASFATACHARGVPVIVDAAAEPDPKSYLDAGADLVIFSVHKRLAGLTGGIVAGRLDLVQATYWQEKGIGRPMKVGKETVISAIAALERWMARDRDIVARELDERLARAVELLSGLPGIRAASEIDSTTPSFSRLHLYVDADAAGLSAFELSQELWNNATPSINIRNLMADIGLLQLDLRLQTMESTTWICGEIVRIARAAAGKKRPAGSAARPPAANLADLTVEGMKRWPLTLAPRA
jgi:L-seryl-tRNA(Ser) seleniumtransferase